MKAYEKILRARGHTPTSLDSKRQSAFEDTGGYPQMGFSIMQKNGSVDGFMYHNLDNLDLKKNGNGEYLSFTHRGKAVTLHGYNLESIFQGIMQHTLSTIRECEEAQAASGGEALVDRIAITLVRGKGMER